jgi:hypothetical protein
MLKNKWFLLQLFAGEGGGAGGSAGAGASGGEGGGEGAVSGVNDGLAAEDQRLRELGVPEEKLRKRAQRAKAKLPEGAVRTAPMKAQEPKPQEQVATAEPNPTEEKTEPNAPARMSWEEIMADPEYNKQMQSVVQSRLKNAKNAEESLAKLAPALEVLARRHGLDAENMDYEAIAKAINDDDAYYEDKALEMGVSVEAAKRIDQQERDHARAQKEEARNLEQQRFQQHIMKLEQQGEALKQVFPSFDLRKELQNPVFARMTSPNVGISVEDAYHAVHRKEIMQAGMQVTAQQTAQKISNAIQAGSRRPDENGTSGQSASVTTFDYSKASKADRDALKQKIRAYAARGEKLYPGR